MFTFGIGGGAGGRGGGRGYHTQFVHGRGSRMTMDPRIPTIYAGTEHVGFSPTRQDIACTKREAPRVVRRVA